MAAYRVGGRYSSRRDGQDFGPWLGGETVELTEADAEWVNRDCEGLLTEVVDEPAPAAAEPDTPKPKKATKANRQHTESQRRW